MTIDQIKITGKYIAPGMPDAPLPDDGIYTVDLVVRERGDLLVILLYDVDWYLDSETKTKMPFSKGFPMEHFLRYATEI